MVIGSPFLYRERKVPRVTFARLLVGVPRGEWELYLLWVRHRARKGRAARADGRMPRAREAHERFKTGDAKYMTKYLSTLGTYDIYIKRKKGVQDSIESGLELLEVEINYLPSRVEKKRERRRERKKNPSGFWSELTASFIPRVHDGFYCVQLSISPKILWCFLGLRLTACSSATQEAALFAGDPLS